MLRLLLVRVSVCLAVLTSPLAAVGEVIKRGDVEFSVDDVVNATYPELVALILATESMDDEERQYWFDIMPTMTAAQIDRLFDILETERKKLIDLEKKYQGQILELNHKSFLTFQTEMIKERFEEDPLNMSNTYLPLIEFRSLDRIVFKRFDSFDDIPTVPLNQIIPEYESDDLVAPLVLSQFYQDLLNSGVLTREDGVAIVRYADLLINERTFYEEFWKEDSYKAFIRIGADQLKRTGQLRLAQDMAQRVPDILNSNDFETYDARIARLTSRIKELLVQGDNNAVYWTLANLSSLAVLLDSTACDQQCKSLYQEGLGYILAQPERLQQDVIEIFESERGDDYLLWMSFTALKLSFHAILSDDYTTKYDLKQLAEDHGQFFLPIIEERLAESSFRWNGPNDDDALKTFILERMQNDGTWRSQQAGWAWYAEFLKHFERGTLPELNDALKQIWDEESAAGRISNLNLIEGPLLEAQTWSAVYMMVSGKCATERRRMEFYIRHALEHGQDPNTSAYAYYEKSVARVLTSPRLNRFNCVGEAQEARARDDWHAVLIGLADTTPGAPGHELPVSHNFYLGEVPHNDVALMEAALDQSDIRWNITKLTGSEVTRRNINITLSTVAQDMDDDDHLLVYFSGHGMKESGDIGTYLILGNGQEYDVGAMIIRMHSAGAKHSVLILDTCRTEEAPRIVTPSKSVSGDYRYSKSLSSDNQHYDQSLAVIYSASDNAPAHIAEGLRYSAFTQHFARVLAGERALGDSSQNEISLLSAFKEAGAQLNDSTIVQWPEAQVYQGGMDWIIARYTGEKLVLVGEK